MSLKYDVLHCKKFSMYIYFLAKSREICVPGVPKHMKRFESLITFDSAKICCLLFLLINVLYIEML